MKTTAAFTTHIDEDIKAVEILMRSQADSYHSILAEALDVILSSGGKRIRPALVLLTGKMLGAPKEQLICLSAAIELLHTATLVHDDLIDQSLMRRGAATLTSMWTPGATVLTGDFVFACAADLAAQTNSLSVMRLFAKTLTTIVNGEISQLFGSYDKVSRENYNHRTYAKTASLFETSACSAALISQVSDEVIENMRGFGRNIGIAFQFIDDILDFTGDQAKLGKPTGTDLRQGVITLPTLIYIENNQENPDVQYLVDGNNKKDSECINRLVESIRTSTAIQSAYEEANRFVESGLEHLENQPPGPERKMLEDLARYIVQRKL